VLAKRRGAVATSALAAPALGPVGRRRIFGTQEPIEKLEPFSPVALIKVQPFLCRGKQCGFYPTHVRATLNTTTDESSPLQHLDVF